MCNIYKKTKGLFVDLIAKDNLSKEKSAKAKNALDDSIQSVTGEFRIKRKDTFDERLQNMSAGTFQVVGDSVNELDGSTKHFLCVCKECGYKRQIRDMDLLSNSVNCANCLELRLSEEAQHFGLTKLGQAELGSTARRSYKIDSCGHKRDIATADVRLGQFSCTECLQDEMIRDMKKHGLTYLSPAKQTPSGAVQKYFVFKSCGHVGVGVRGTLMRGGSVCRECANDKLQDNVDSFGFTVLSVEPGARRKIRFNSCGHEKIVGLSNAKSGSVSCNECEILLWKTDAEEVGLMYSRYISHKKHAYLAPCGHEIINKPAHIRIGHWTCRTCNAGFKKFRSFLYIFKMKSGDFEWIKLGFGKSPDRRKNDYKLASGVEFSLISKVEVENGAVAEHLERILHKKYKPFNIDKSLMKNYMTESGFTETYPSNLLEDMQFELEVCDGMTQKELDSILLET